MNIIDRLTELEKAATADGWKVERSDGDLEVGCPDRFDVVTLTGAPICTMMCGTYSECEANGEIIAAARNALPALLKVAAAAKAYHSLANGPYDDTREGEFLELQAELGEALAELEAK